MAGTNYPSQRPTFLQALDGDPRSENRENVAGLYPGQIGQQFPWRNPADPDGNQLGFQVAVLDSAVDVAVAAGQPAYWRNSTGYVVTNDVSVAGRGNLAGVFGGAVTVDYICCIQQKGPASVQLQTAPTSTPDNTGKIVIPSATDGKVDVLAAGSAATYPPLGVSIGFASGGLFTADLNIEGRP